MNKDELQEIIEHVDEVVKSTLKKLKQVDGLYSRLGIIHFRLSLLPESEAVNTLLRRTKDVTEGYYEQAVELRILCQDLKEHLKELKKENKQKTSGGSATARTQGE